MATLNQLDFYGLTFGHDDLVSEGGERFVYRHLSYPNFVFKRQKKGEELERKSGLKGWMLRRFPESTKRIIRKEYRAYVDTCLAEYDDDLDKLPVSKIYSFAQSNIGVVQISEKITLDGVNIGPTLIGPTLANLHQTIGISAEKIEMMNNFVDLLLRFYMPTNDVSAQNIVLGKRNGIEGLFCVDGFVDIHLILVWTYYYRVRRDMLAERMQKMAFGLNIYFDKKSLCFSMS